MDDEERKTISFQIQKSDYEALKGYAKYEKKVTVSWMLRDLVATFVETIQSKQG